MRNGKERQQRSVAEVRASIEQSTLDLKSALERLEQGARAKLDVGRRIAGKATTVLLMGFVAGMLLGLATARPPVRRW